MLNIAVISTFPPTQCGIATYSNDLIHALKSISNTCHFTKIELLPTLRQHQNKNYFLENHITAEYFRAAEYINASKINLVDIQHEFKIFGKPDGENILILLSRINKPIATTLHTVFSNLNPQREHILSEIVKRSDMLFVFSKEAKWHLIEKYKARGSKIIVIPHGVPLVQYKTPKQIPERAAFKEKIIFLSAGHMRDTKGYELAINALSYLQKEIGDFHYFIIGANHPENEAAQSYRNGLADLILRLDLSSHITFISHYLNQENLIKYIQLSDVCLLPYTRPDQSSSGTLALMLSCGRPVVSTPFQFAKSYLTESAGAISRSFHHEDFEEAIRVLIKRSGLWPNISKHNYTLCRSWQWKFVAKEYSLGYIKAIAK